MTHGVAVEFLGLPGVGKSSLSRCVAEILDRERLPVAEPTYRLDHGPSPLERAMRKSWHVAREIVAHPGYAAQSAAALRTTRQESAALLCTMTFNWLLVSALMRRARRSSGVTLFDQGIFQALWSIGLGSAAGAIRGMGRVLEGSAPTADAVIVLEASTERVARRLAERRGRDSRADRWAADDAARFSRSVALLAEVEELLRAAGRRSGGPRVIRVRNESDSDLEANAAEVAGWVRRLLAGTRA